MFFMILNLGRKTEESWQFFAGQKNLQKYIFYLFVSNHFLQPHKGLAYHKSQLTIRMMTLSIIIKHYGIEHNGPWFLCWLSKCKVSLFSLTLFIMCPVLLGITGNWIFFTLLFFHALTLSYIWVNTEMTMEQTKQIYPSTFNS